MPKIQWNFKAKTETRCEDCGNMLQLSTILHNLFHDRIQMVFGYKHIVPYAPLCKKCNKRIIDNLANSLTDKEARKYGIIKPTK